MKVFIVQDAYGDGMIFGVWSTKEQAEACTKEQEEVAPAQIVEWEVDGHCFHVQFRKAVWKAKEEL